MSRIDDIADELVFLMPQIGRRMVLGFFQRYPVTPAQIFSIMAVYENGPCRLSKISRFMQISAPTATGIVDRLLKSGYVRRKPDPADRRAVLVDLTPRGRRLARDYQQMIKLKWVNVIDKMKPGDREKFLESIKTIISQLP